MQKPTPNTPPIDWFTLTYGIVLGAVIGGMLGLSFAPSWVVFA